MAKAPGTPPARGQRPRCQPAFAVLVMTPPSRHSISGFGSTSVLLTWWARWVRITPLHGGVSSPGAQSFAQEAARAHAWAGTDSASPPALEACLRRAGSQPLPGVKLPPGASGSFSAKVEAHASIGTGTERCLSPAAAGEQPWEAAGRPTLAGRAAPPHCSGSGVAACVLETEQTLTNSAWFPPTSLQAYLVAQPKPEAPEHLSLPGPRGLRWPSEPCWGFLIQGENSSAWPRGAQCLSVAAPWLAQGEHGPRHREALKGAPGSQNLEVLCCRCYFSIN